MSWSEETIQNIERQHKELRLAYIHDSALKSILDQCDSQTFFQAG